MYYDFQSYKQWKEALPDMAWLESVLPSPEKLDSWNAKATEMKEKIINFEIDPRIKDIGQSSYDDLRRWFDQRLDGEIGRAHV